MALPSAILQRGTRAAQPAASSVAEGVTYYVTDEVLTEQSVSGTWQPYSASGSASGDVIGPASSVDKELALFDGATGKLLEAATGTGYVKVTAGVLGTPAATVPVADGGTNLSSYTAGDLLYATGGTTLAKLPIGTAAQVLTVNGGATAPAWAAAAGGGGLVLLQTVSATASASIELTGLSSSYTNYLITVTNYVVATDSSHILITFSEGGTYYATNYRWIMEANGTTAPWSNVKSAADSSIHLWNNADNALPVHFHAYLLGTTNAGGYAMVQAQLSGFANTAEFYKLSTVGTHAVTTALDKVKFTQSAGNITTGTARLYGLAQ